MTFRLASLVLVCWLVGAVTFGEHQAEADHHHHSPALAPDGSRLKIPAALQADHQELHEELLQATKVGGETGKAAQKVADKLHAHFVAEEKFALPPLGLLKAVVHGETAGAGAEEAIRLSDQLKQGYKRMLAEHVEIKQALADLESAAGKESRPEQQEFARKLALHAETEETVLYPATLLLGEYLKVVREKQ